MFKMGLMKTKDWQITELLRVHGVGRGSLGYVFGISLFILLMILMILFEVLKYKGLDPYRLVSRQNCIIRWGIYWIITFAIVCNIFGSQADFIYAGF